MTLPTPNDGLRAGLDFRLPQYRRAVWHRFYSFHLRYQSHPGGVYYALPALAEAGGWDLEQRLWCAFLNGNTQNPVTTHLLMQAGARPSKAERVLRFWREHYADLGWDTDRRYHKAHLDQAIAGYVELTRPSQCRYWAQALQGGWEECWKAATAIPTFGRLSAWSYLEYVRIVGMPIPDAATLLLGDKDGSRSHRNGLCLLLGLDDWVWWDSNPGFDGRYPPDLTSWLEEQGKDLLTEARYRNINNPARDDVGYLTLESALCTWKSWHRPNRRYTGVYNDLLFNRLRHAEARFGKQFDVLWDARWRALPTYLRLEDCPTDPGAVPVKQNHYRETGEVIVLGHEWPELWSTFDQAVVDGKFGKRPA
jgi:hypothetical protein